MEGGGVFSGCFRVRLFTVDVLYGFRIIIVIMILELYRFELDLVMFTTSRLCSFFEVSFLVGKLTGCEG